MKSLRFFGILATSLAVLTAVPRMAEAQRRARVRPAVRSVVFIGGFYYPRYPLFDPWYDPWYGPWGPYGFYEPYGQYYGQYYGYPRDYSASIRVEVTPRDAQVIVDGYSAGIVDDFDGVFQRLRLRPGGHELVLYLDGYRTIRQRIYVSPGSDQKVRYTMERLAAGETSEPPPPAQQDDRGSGSQPPPPPPAPGEGPRGVEPREPRQPGPGRYESLDFGTLSIRVQPADADILVDGERWSAPSDLDRVAIRLSEGRHHVEVRKSGFSSYTEDVLIRAGRTLSLNVSLLRGDGRPE